MRRWEEAGEVPDSDDEALDLQLHPLTTLSINTQSKYNHEEPYDGPKTVTWHQHIKENLSIHSSVDGTTQPLIEEDHNDTGYEQTCISSDELLERPHKQASPKSNWLLDQLSPSEASQETFRTALSARRPQTTASNHLSTPARPSLHQAPSSVNSSPLSELSASPPSASGPVLLLAARQQHEASNDDPEYHNILRALEAERDGEPVHQRSLRQRTTKQLHPFLEERARYLQQCKDRGMRPVRVLEAISTLPDEDTQLEDSSQRSGSHVSFRSPPQQNTKVLDNFASTDLDIIGTQNDLQDDEAVQHRPVHHGVHHSVQSGCKRRKLDHVRHAASTQHQRTSPHSADVFAIPPSPPISPGLPLLDDHVAALPRPRFRLPPGVTPQQSLPTPEVSSEPHLSTDKLHQEHDEEPTTARSTGRGPIVLSDTDTESSTDHEDEIDQPQAEVNAGIHAQKKRIKGVLPASWLKIDLLAQHKRKEVIRTHPTVDDQKLPLSPSLPQKGIARKITGQHVQEPTDKTRIVISDDDASSDSDSGKDRLPSYRQQRLPFDAATNSTMFVDVDDMEHDYIDALLPTGATKAKKPKQRQPLIRDVLSRARNEDSSRALDVSERRVRSKPASRARASTKRSHRTRRRVPQLGILDAIGPADAAADKQPQFVRIAARAARKTSKGARQSPTSKYLQLATRQDTHDAHQTLRDWRAGSILQQAIAKPKPVAIPAAIEPHQAALVKVRRLHIPDYRPQPRPAQLESLETDLRRRSRAAAFQLRISALTTSLSRQQLSYAAVQRWQSGGGEHASPTELEDHNHRYAGAYQTANAPTAARSAATSAIRPTTTRLRKRRPLHINIEDEEYTQPQTTESPSISTNPQADQVYTESPYHEARPTLDLSAIALPYTVDFSVQPFGRGIAFPESTFIGSGDFAQSLTLAKRSLQESSGRIRIQLGDSTCDWAAWTEEVRAGLFQIPDVIASAIRSLSTFSSSEAQSEGATNVASNITYLLKSLIQYCTHCLYFYDAVDRSACIEALLRFCRDMHTLALGDISKDDDGDKLKILMLQYTLVLAAQVTRLATHETISSLQRMQCQDLGRDIATSLVSMLLSDSDGLSNSCQMINRNGGSRGLTDSTLASSIVILHHVLQQSASSTSLWRIINGVLEQEVSTTFSAKQIESAWRITFLLLPLLDFTDKGKLPCVPSFQGLPDDWTLLKTAMKRVFELYDQTAGIPGSMINSYIRTLLARSMVLVTQWRWWKCEIWLATIYDFFIHRRLALLNGESSTGSPAFLDALTSQPDLVIQPSDNSYQLFLKLVAVGVRSMHQHSVYAGKRIASLYWRLIPGNPRVYRKDADMQQADLDSLRNHYDLLSVLYYASPPSNRLPVTVLTGLVDHATSHRAACRMSVRAWTRLASFQASLDEPLTRLDEFIKWYHEILDATVSQYRLARIEAEDDFHRARATASFAVSTSLLETIVLNNQVQVAATLVDTLAGIKRTITSARNVKTALYVATLSEYWKTFAEFDLSERPLKSVFIEGLAVIHACIERTRSNQQASAGQQTEDSQDYGDASALDAYMSTLDDEQAHKASLITLLVAPMAQFISNTFGAERLPDDTILNKALDTWFFLLKQMVTFGTTRWGDVLEGYSAVSWRKLRDTSQRRIFTPRLLSMILESTDEADDLPFASILAAWLRSIVERESTLKFQHDLTNALLNSFRNEPLFHNLPLARTTLGVFDISLQEFRQCRLAMLAAVFSNMRDDLESTYTTRRGQASERRRLYAECLRELMIAMRSNYIETQAASSTITADVGARGAYVEFVQSIVSLMQQYTGGICTVDRFFTDSAAFPLPADDPTYVVGRVKSYAPKLLQSNIQKELAVFMHTVCERALVDGEQAYLISQLSLAVDGDIEHGDPAMPSLRYFLLAAVMPAYIELIPRHDLAWCPALPMLEVAQSTTGDLLYSMDVNSSQSMLAMIDMVACIVMSATESASLLFEKAIDVAEGVDLALRSLIHLCSTSLVVAEYLSRTIGDATQIAARLSWFAIRCETFIAHMDTSNDQMDDIVLLDSSEPSNAMTCGMLWREGRTFMSNQIMTSLSNDWTQRGSRLELRRGTAWKEVIMRSHEITDAESTVHVVRCYLSAYRELFSRRSRPRYGHRNDDISLGLSQILVI